MSKLRIASDLSLPLDAVTQAIGIIAKRRAGKSYTARRVVEQLILAGQQVVIADPKGDWWGIRSAADGKAPGLQVIILGGERGDLPLEVGAGEVIAKLVTEERVSVLLDLSLFRKHEVATFMTAFLEGLYRMKAREEFRTPVMLVIDEADAIAPQKPQPNEARMLGAAEDIVRRGGQRGIGCMMITQRSAVLNKNVLTQVEVLIALRTIAPQDLKALDAWVEVHGEESQRDTLMGSLPSLPVGDAWVWSPGWPTSAGIFKRVHVLPIETFDSGASPKAGEKRAEPKKVADVDLGALQRQMSETIEKAKASDPKELRKRIAELERELAKKPAAAGRDEVALAVSNARGLWAKETARAITAAQKDTVRRLGLAVRDIRGVVHRLAGMASVIDDLTGLGAALQTMADAEYPAIEETVGSRAVTAGERASTQTEQHNAPAPERHRIARQSVAPRDRVDGLPPGQQKLLDAAARLRSVNIEAPLRAHVAALAPMSPTSSATERHFAGLIKAGLFSVPESGAVALTEAGLSAAATFDAPPTIHEYLDSWRNLLSGGEVKLFDAMTDRVRGAGPITRADLASRAGISSTSSATERAFAWLISLGLLEKAGSGAVVAGKTMFPEGLK